MVGWELTAGEQQLTERAYLSPDWSGSQKSPTPFGAGDFPISSQRLLLSAFLGLRALGAAFLLVVRASATSATFAFEAS